MIAEVEQLDYSYKRVEMEPPTGCFYCDHCGDCLRCDHWEGFCYNGALPMWVIYLGDELNPNG
jgi:hypothetical protein